jgi:hypothetical protein
VSAALAQARGADDIVKNGKHGAISVGLLAVILAQDPRAAKFGWFSCCKLC